MKFLLATIAFACCFNSLAVESDFKLPLRSRVELAKDSGLYNVQWKSASWDAKKTAVIVCDMWDNHWCVNAALRVGEMAPRMNELVVEARKRGALIIHCPSDTMDYYKDTPQYKLAQSAPVVETKVKLEKWRGLDLEREAPLPIDDSDGGCDCDTLIIPFKAWKKQIDAIKIEDGDGVTDSAQAYHLMRQRGIENVLVMGVHLNMCVLGRPFSIRQLVVQGLNVALVRDMTDALYNPEKEPFASHFTGTDLMVEHVEKFWCPTVSSADILGGSEFRFKGDMRKRLLMIMAEDEYKTSETLPKFALEKLSKEYSVSSVFGGAKTDRRLQGLELIKGADAVLLSVRRRLLEKDQLDLIRAHVAKGKPLVAIRTSCHAFAPGAKDKVPEGCDAWLDFGKSILGCNYNNHHGSKIKTQVLPIPASLDNQFTKAFDTTGYVSNGSLYKVAPLDPKAAPLLMGSIPGAPSEYVAWTLVREGGQRVFVTTLGHPDDFTVPSFVQFLKNGIDWSVGK